MTVYVPGTAETDPKKQNRSIQAVGAAATQNATDIATANTNIAALQAGPLVSGAVAAKSDEVAGTSTTLATTPGRQQFHPSAAKAWGFVTYSGATPTLQASFNVQGIVATSTGVLTVTMTTAMTSANYAILVSAQQSVTNVNVANVPTITSSSVFVLTHYENSAGSAVVTNPLSFHFVVFGTQ